MHTMPQLDLMESGYWLIHQIDIIRHLQWCTVHEANSISQAYLMVTVDVRDINDPPVFVEVNTDLAVTEVSEI